MKSIAKLFLILLVFGSAVAGASLDIDINAPRFFKTRDGKIDENALENLLRTRLNGRPIIVKLRTTLADYAFNLLDSQYLDYHLYVITDFVHENVCQVVLLSNSKEIAIRDCVYHDEALVIGGRVKYNEVGLR